MHKHDSGFIEQKRPKIPTGLHNMVMLNIYFKIISGFIFESLTRLSEKIVPHFGLFFRFWAPYRGRE